MACGESKTMYSGDDNGILNENGKSGIHETGLSIC